MKKSLNKRPWRIISGGQTGVDRAGLVAAMTYCIPILAYWNEKMSFDDLLAELRQTGRGASLSKSCRE